MSIGIHTKFSSQVISEFKRREEDFGVGGISKKVYHGTDSSGDLLSTPVDLEDDTIDPFKGGRVVWTRVASGGRVALGENALEVYRKDWAINIGIKPDAPVINGIILEPSTTFDSGYGTNKAGGYQTLGIPISPTDGGDFDVKNMLSVGDNYIKIFSDRQRPSPIIESISVKHNTRGTVVEADFTWKAYTQEQFETLSAYFCSLRKTVVLEWGWSSFKGSRIDLSDTNLVKLLQLAQPISSIKSAIKSSSDSGGSLGNIDINDSILQGASTSLESDSLTPKEKFELKQGVDYGVFVGMVVTYSIDMSDGMYSVTTTLRSIGDGIAGLDIDKVLASYFNEGQMDSDIRDRLNSEGGDPRIFIKEADTINEDAQYSSVEEFIAEEQEQGDITDNSETANINRGKLLHQAIIMEPRSWVFHENSIIWKHLAAYYDGTDTRTIKRYVPRIDELKDAGFSYNLVRSIMWVSTSELHRAITRQGGLVLHWQMVDPPEGSTWQYLNPTIPAGLGDYVGDDLLHGIISFDEANNRLPDGDVSKDSRRAFRSQLWNLVVRHNLSSIGSPVQKVLEFQISENNYIGSDGWYFFYDPEEPTESAGTVKGHTIVNKPIKSFLDEYDNTIRWHLQLEHDLRFSEISSFKDIMSPPSRKDTMFTEDEIHNKFSHVYDAIKHHLQNNAAGRVFAEKYNVGIQNGIEPLAEQKLNEFLSGAFLHESQIGRYKFDYDNPILMKALLEQHAGYTDTRTVTTGESAFGGGTVTERVPKQSFQFITWGLFEELLNSALSITDGAFVGLLSDDAKISFKPNLISTDGGVCLIPNRNAPQFANGERVGSADLSIHGISTDKKYNKDGTTSIIDEPDKNMWLSSIFLNVDFIKSVFKTARTVRGGLETLLSYINGACSDLFSFDVYTVGSSIYVMDTRSIDSDTISKDSIYVFSYGKANSFLRSVNLNIAPSQEVAAATALGATVSVVLSSPTYASIVPLIGDTSDLYSVRESTDDLKEREPKEKTIIRDTDWKNFWQYNDSGLLVNYVYPDTDAVAMLVHGESAEPINSNIPVPGVSVSITLDGLSGIRSFSDVFLIDSIPSVYLKSGFFFVSSVDHQISNGKWLTTINGQFKTGKL